jgi:hypothetical protein
LLAACASEGTTPTSQQDDIELIDTDGDGAPDALDLDCDGVADVSL